jgi:hypothetical protein
VSFAIHQPRLLLVLADDPAQARDFKDVHDYLRDFTAVVRKPKEILDQGPNALNPYAAVVLFNVAAPGAELWELLKDYVIKNGRGLAIVPGGEKTDIAAYNTPAAQQLMPGQLGKIMNAASEAAGRWNWDTMTFQHPMLAPFREWKAANFDIFSKPNSVSRYWEIKPKGQGTPIIHYAADGSPPALLDRGFEAKAGGRQGHVLLFTTRLDRSRPAWNDYFKTFRLTTYFALLRYSARYLAGDLEPVRMNFLSGQTVPVVALPLAGRLNAYTLLRDGEVVDTVTAEADLNELRLPQALTPGNYGVEGAGKGVGLFSVNLPPEECLLTRVPVADVEALFGKDSVAPLDLRADLRKALEGQWSQPQELLPWLMVLVLLLLAVENLLANKFYRKTSEPAA